VLNTLGFFLRALSTVYSIADCERLVNDSISLSNEGIPPLVQVLNCSTNLNDVTRVINGARVPLPAQYTEVAQQAQKLVPKLTTAAFGRNQDALADILVTLQEMRHSIATITPTPDLP
jgi:hypothetical protein